MKITKQLLALVLAAALMISTMSVAFANRGSGLISYAGALSSPVGVSTVTVSPQSATVAKGATQAFTATVMAGLTNVTKDVTVDWSVEGRNNLQGTGIDAQGVLIVAADESAAELTVIATAEGVKGTATVTVTAPAHVHDATCLTAYVGTYGNGFLSLDTGEVNGKSDYLSVYLSCTESPATAESFSASDVLVLSVTGKLADILTTTGITHEDSTLYTRLTLKEGKTLQGVHEVPLQLTLNGKAIPVSQGDKMSVTLYAEKFDPAYIDGPAVIDVDLGDIKESYTASPVELKIPGGVRTIGSVTTDEYAPYTVKLVEDKLVLSTKENVAYLNSEVYVTITFKARKAPLKVRIPVEFSVVNNDVLTLAYDKELTLPDKASTTVVPSIAEKYADVATIEQYDYANIRTQGIYVDRQKMEYAQTKLTARNKGEGTFSYEVNYQVQKKDADGNTLVGFWASSTVTNNPIKVSGDVEGVYQPFVTTADDNEIDLNNLATYTRELFVCNAENIEKVKLVAVEGSTDLRSHFTVEFGELDATEKRIPLTLTMANSSALVLADNYLNLDFEIKVKDVVEPIKSTTGFRLLANEPTLALYKYNSNDKLTEDTIALGESKKYTLKSEQRDLLTSAWVYGFGLTVVRGERFYTDMGEAEHITVRYDKAAPEILLEISTNYIPTITNKDVKVQVKSTNGWSVSKAGISFNGTGDPDPDPDPKPDPKPDPDPDPTPGGGSGGGNNTANTPATSDKITETVDSIKNLGNVALTNPDAKLPTGVVVDKTAGGTAIATVPVALTTGSANVNLDTFNLLGKAPASVGFKFTVSESSKESVEIIVPGGFGAVTEIGRLSYPMDYKSKADDADKMVAMVKGTGTTTTTAQIGGNFTLPVAATITVKSTAPEGSIVNIYKFDPFTGKMIVIGSAKVVKGQLTFATKLMGQMLFTTGKI